MKPASIAYFIGSLDTGGAEGQVMELLRRLDRTRFRLRLILFEPSTTHRAADLVEDVFVLDIPKEPVKAYRPRGYRALAAFARLCRYLRRTRPDILHAHLPASCILGLTAGRLCRIPVVIGSRRSLSGLYRASDWRYNLADRLTTRFGHFMLGNADAVTREIVTIDGCPVNRTTTIHNGVDTERFRPEESDVWRRHHGWTNREVVFGLVANFYGYKRHVDFVEAAAILHQRHPQARFVLVGEDRGEMPVVRAAIGRSSLDSVVRVVPGTSRPEDVYSAIDVLVCCSDSEGFSNVILEAMASGKPVIATAAGGNTEAVVEGATGFLVPCRSPLAIAHAAERLLQNRELCQSMGRKARQRAEGKFSLQKMVRAHEDLYARLLEQRCYRSLASSSERVTPTQAANAASGVLE